MIRQRLNLKCRKGHKHYSPMPEQFVGKGCMYPLGGTGVVRRCQEPLRILRTEEKK